MISLFLGNKHEDHRGIITYNNDFDASQIKRIYTIENQTIDFIRGWQGHQIEQRWFAAVNGSFEISIICVDDFLNPNSDLEVNKFTLNSDVLTYLHVPAGCISAIKSLEENSKLLVLADYALGEVNDECRFPIDYFKNL